MRSIARWAVTSLWLVSIKNPLGPLLLQSQAWAARSVTSLLVGLYSVSSIFIRAVAWWQVTKVMFTFSKIRFWHRGEWELMLIPFWWCSMNLGHMSRGAKSAKSQMMRHFIFLSPPPPPLLWKSAIWMDWSWMNGHALLLFCTYWRSNHHLDASFISSIY